MLPGPGEETRTCAKDSNVAKLEENRRVYWLPGSAAENTDGAPLITEIRVERLVVEATTDSETETSKSRCSRWFTDSRACTEAFAHYCRT